MNIEWSYAELETIDKFIKQMRSYINTYRPDEDNYTAEHLVTELEQLRSVNYNVSNINLPINIYFYFNGGYYNDDIYYDTETIDFNIHHDHLMNDNFELISTLTLLQNDIKDVNLHDMHVPANVLTNILSNHVITKIVLTNVTSEITTFVGVAKCSNIEYVEFVNFNTPNLISCAEMFTNSNLRYVNITGWNAPNLLDASYMFSECYHLKQIVGSNNFIKSRVRTLEGMLSECEDLQTFDVTGCDISNVTNMSNMFYGCKNLLHIRGLEHLILFSVINMKMMFCGCDRLNNVTITFGDDTEVDKEKITSMFGDNDDECNLYVMVNTKCEKFAIGLS